MVATKLKTRSPIIAMEQGTSKFGSSATVAGAGYTIPVNTGEVWCYPSAACHVNPAGTATSSFIHAIAATEPFMLKAAEVGKAQIIGDAGAITMTVAYMRGSGRADGGGAVTRPY